ncbi:MAG: YjbQ family protein, partial [Sciscionella sp.]
MSTQAAARIAASEFEVRTHGRGFIDLGDPLRSALHESGLREGMALVFTRHTSCSLLISENADPEVRADLERFFA